MRLTTIVLIATIATVGLVADVYPSDIGQVIGLPAATEPDDTGRERQVYDEQPAPVEKPQLFDYSANLASDVFGVNLFTGAFAKQGATQFNPDYCIAAGDTIQVRIWGAFENEALLSVDPQGNIFLPHVGPVRVLGVRNQDLQRVVEGAIGKHFRANVYSYASLASAQPVRVFVSGFVNRPGLYSGTSMDSLLHYLDQAGGIDPDRGSFLDVQVKRGNDIRASVNLYDFLLEGHIPFIQLADGDVIFAGPRQNTVKVTGLVENANRFEYKDSAPTVAGLVKIVKPLPQVTHVRVVKNQGVLKNVEYYPIEDAAKVALQNGDELEFTADRRPGTITVRVEGEHLSSQEYVLPYGSRFGELISLIKFSERSDTKNLQLYRQSVRERQKLMFATALKSLEASVLTARSGTSDEARLRRDEADLILRWIDRAKKVEPSGQVFIARASNRDDLLLENGDIVRVPTKDGLVLINGEVLFPTSIIFDGKLTIDDYIGHGGGYTQNADTSRIIIAHRDGSFEDIGGKSHSLFRDKSSVRPGDEILVLPKIEVKSRQIMKDLTQILFQLAVTTKVIIGL